MIGVVQFKLRVFYYQPAFPTTELWLGKLNNFKGNYIAAEKIRAFITSGEYGNASGHSKPSRARKYLP